MTSPLLPFPSSPHGAYAPDASAGRLPSGTVTFLFSDIEGSTRLLQHLGVQYASVLAQHQRLLRAAWEAHDGREISTEGDSFFVVFARATDALAAAAQAQQALADTQWPDGGVVRVRMGLHTGTPALMGENYIGLDVHRAARIASAGYGGQVLLSESVRALVEGDPGALPEGVRLRDLGEARLKDLRQPEHIFQLLLPGLPSDFPPLRTLDRARHNLPVQLTPLVGREHDVQHLCELVQRPEVRLLTLIGPGGIGKTRLALQVAAELANVFDDGVYFVELAATTASDLAASTIATTLGLRDEGSTTPEERLRSYLTSRRMLLVLDNFEQVAGAAPLLARLLTACPGVKMLVTSRIALHVRGEQEYPVTPLSLPPRGRAADLKAVVQSDAVTLFVERARAVRPDFALTEANASVIAEICARLDALPLAIELAAARIRSLPPQSLLSRLTSRLKLLTGGARDLPERQQTLRNTIAWSYDLLLPEEQVLFRRLAVFGGGWTLEAAEAICNPDEGIPPLDLYVLDGLDSLAAKSLLRQQGGGGEGDESRFQMLETLREYGLEQLRASGEAEVLQQAHLAYYRALVESALPHLHSSDERAWLDALERENDNLRAALGWARERGGATLHDGLRLAGALAEFWFRCGYLSEGREWLEALLALDRAEPDVLGDSDTATRVRARALYGAGDLAQWQGDAEHASIRLGECLRLARAVGDLKLAAAALNRIGIVLDMQQDMPSAIAAFEESLALAREAGDRLGMSKALNNLGELCIEQHEWNKAAAFYEEALTCSPGGSGDAVVLTNLGRAAWKQGNLRKAEQLLREATTLTLMQAAPHDVAEQAEVLALTLQTAPLQAAQLFGAASAARKLLGTPPTPALHAEIDEAQAAGRSAIGEAAWAAAYAAGEALTPEEAIALAMETPPPKD